MIACIGQLVGASLSATREYDDSLRRRANGVSLSATREYDDGLGREYDDSLGRRASGTSLSATRGYDDSSLCRKASSVHLPTTYHDRRIIYCC